jgi:hypothetical protein
MRQAARRAWRIGQPRECYVYYLYYKDTMQHRAMHLMSKKMAAALALEGEFSVDGLAAMAGDDNMQMALAKSMAEKIDQADMQRSWSKVKSGDKKKPRKEQSGLAERSRDAKPTPLGTLPNATLAERFAQADAGMWAAAHAMARGVELEPVAAEPETGPVRLTVYEPDPVPETPDVLTEVELPEFDEALLAKMFANLASHGTTLQHLAG